MQSIIILKKKILPELINNQMGQSDNISSYIDQIFSIQIVKIAYWTWSLSGNDRCLLVFNSDRGSC